MYILNFHISSIPKTPKHPTTFSIVEFFICLFLLSILYTKNLDLDCAL